MPLTGPRVVVFGATGFTGALVARALVAGGVRPLLAGRDRARLAELAAELGGLDHAVADAGRPRTVRRLLDAGDVLVTTVGPFLRLGQGALAAAVDAGAHYLDSTGEPAFIRGVFDTAGPRTRGRCALVPAMGYEYVPGNVAAGLALAEAGRPAARVDVLYLPGRRDGTQARPSPGTAASVVALAFEPSFAWRDGRVQEARPADRHVALDVGHRRVQGLSIGGSEHLSLPRLWSQLEEVNVYVGGFGAAAPVVHRAWTGVYPVVRWARLARPARAVLGAAASRAAGRGARPDAGSSKVVARAHDRSGALLAEVALTGPGPYRFTADVLAWAAHRAADGGLLTTGALGPVEAFGLDTLARGCAEVGLVRA